ncbi:2-dehydropantoate 2-reductase [Spizellomyces punctatus DAOM BR117]|uniref:2-dehydropantoate 2-reductase n=1 Tax=Spizellomyces punctatus (strain DAOM BR117) TaxID=645134 RepID=A0A0L0HFP8_SPIPD|nr:2-dehydropantoate 2-reductase, variant [Spizellomyces punctatus DAOM BR117]XP_016607790.1 2-dehydropantoate 2-reductase [Spizellomyces punctatus DAOM BR117]KNC99749.1 2-dehydropantoate 2-reductase, variant [Spizellomyces punctatus DAOM BR117]KNC99750.1 2-dehydropantoate 2-reductase [Spizellomyces punctatus DAOM BR117]|eukprot:XP_016607789.1 2-dehydropantoate 2-reductase, variant [Spizellomyces punctatus DAOM BR117]
MSSRFYILGAGAIGLFHAHHIRTFLHTPVTLLLRAPTLTQFHAANNTLTIQTSDRTVIGTSTLDAEEPTPDGPPIENLIICTKAHDTLAALDPISPRLSSNSTILLLQNGVLGVYTSLRRSLSSPSTGGPRILLGITTHGVTLTERFTAIHAGDGETSIGDPEQGQVGQDRVNTFLEHVSRAGWSTTLSYPDFYQKLLLKLVVNTCLNPLTSLFNTPNGSLTTPHGQNLIHLICKDLSTLFPDLGLSPTELTSHVLDIANRTALNRNSMERDVYAGRRTEVDFLVGYCVELAREREVEVPILEFLWEAVKMREEIGMRMKREAQKLR